MNQRQRQEQQQQQGMQLNSLGTSQINNKQYNLAIKNLTNAIKTIGKHIAYLKKVNKTQSHQQPNTSSSSSCQVQETLDTWIMQSLGDSSNTSTCLTDCRTNKSTPPPPSPHHYDDVDDKDSFLYKTPIIIDATSIPWNCLESNTAVSMVMSFNLALAHHLAAIGQEQLQKEQEQDDESSREVLIEKAAKIYKLVLKLQKDNGWRSNVLFVMATLNNLGHVYILVDDKETAQSYFRRLLQSCHEKLTSVGSNDDGGSNDGDVSLCLQGFMSNMTYLIFGKTHTAAAA